MDSNDRERITEAQEELQKMVSLKKKKSQMYKSGSQLSENGGLEEEKKS